MWFSAAIFSSFITHERGRFLQVKMGDWTVLCWQHGA
jgi:hypothetical protein